MAISQKKQFNNKKGSITFIIFIIVLIALAAGYGKGPEIETPIVIP